MESLNNILSQAVSKNPEKIAIVFGQKKISFQEISEKSCSISTALLSWGIREGDRVALLLDNSPEFIFCYFGILATGAIVVPINHMFKRDEIRFILEDSQSRFLITSKVYAEIALELNCIVSTLESIIFTNHRHNTALNLSETLNKQNKSETTTIKPLGTDSLAIFLYTSGTTGHPKAAMLSHGNLLANIQSSANAIKITPKDVVICFLPLFHSFAATVCMLMPLAYGAKIVLLKSPSPIKRLLRAIRNNRVTIFVGIPSIYNILKDIKLPKFLLPFLLKFLNPVRVALSGAAALPTEVFEKFEKKYHIPLLEGYGLTEASPVVSLNPLNGKRKAGSIGLAISQVSVKIIGDTGKELPLGSIGELCVKGPNVMQGYFNQKEENKTTIIDGWLLTGDMAKIDNENYIYIMGRKKDMVNVRGLNVYPREIEDVLYQNPAIKEAAVIGIPDAHKGEVPKGFVVLKPGAQITEHEIIAFLKNHLALYKIPKRIEIRSELPKNQAGKILKRVLSQEHSNVSVEPRAE